MKTAALVPFKRFTHAKQRLRERFSDAQVESLGRAMLEDVLDALCHSSLERVSVLTDDPEVASVARGAGAQVRLRQPDPGLNPAIDDAEAELFSDGYGASLVVLGDLPLLEPSHVERVLGTDPTIPVVIVPSCDGGTAMLLRRPPACMPSRFGKASAAAHLAEARARGLAVLELGELETQARLDLDTPEDAARLVQEGRQCRTRSLLEQYLR